ncbi:alpha/beta hydrolase [Leptospira sp. 2 VSF19]|uniref:Alpha/beta hydrolase n=1 Tax=Leptospira soteropolitanensis TaxID=2950025 RepID=A0AAW5VGK2_9LEPT|nr:alpha/beta fold hydrolase [Leptospira soteropolitanensis]MCW7494419.1 alpha/beta hydrolase [Leptospira soteropolitanensis]MCW7502014.1 alpha/beta hydrolase [Leptospira soteropolitanensis]MCW7524265.1 alpha/beta hydrolase [Leptospira soteropolitanensis]MCW7528130.1 alpha/beta hydrolase [Leptospira soteropolitanensis]MCW7531984.1 alpha/beta hydrolase [Leptospira soteropolitanensis]
MVLSIFAFGIWSASNQILFPKWKGITKDFLECSSLGERLWGKFCGNIRLTKEFEFREVSIRSFNGYELPGWFVPALANGVGFQKGVILLVHGGGADRRELTRFIPFYLNQGFDVFSFDLSCHGEAPCQFPGLSFGNRESVDVLSAYLYLSKKYQNILMMGSSVGATSILISLPFLEQVKGLVLENPMLSFHRLILDSPESSGLPHWMVQTLIELVTIRGKFDTLLSPENSLPLAANVPLLIIHSKNDMVVSYQHSIALAKLYSGPSEVWFPDLGSHGMVWEANQVEYEMRVRDFIQRNTNDRKTR